MRATTHKFPYTSNGKLCLYASRPFILVRVIQRSSPFLNIINSFKGFIQ